MGNPFVHVELSSTDPEAAKAFYGELFSWHLEDTQMPVGTYTMVNPGDGVGGGMMRQPIPGAPSAWLPYVVVDDVKSSVEKAVSLGANVTMDVTAIPGMGHYAIIEDPTGASIGLWQTA